MKKKKIVPISRPNIGSEEIKAVRDVLKSGSLAQGKQVAKFENAFARFCGTKHAVAVGNGTQALTLSLLALEPPLNSLKRTHKRFEVITSPFTFIATANSILASGGTPVFVDIDPETFNVDPQLVKKAIGPHTRVIMPVHIYGQPVDMSPLIELAQKKDLAIIEDACQAHGATYKGKKAGNLQDDIPSSSATFSFYPSKNMTTGEGGMITTNDPDLTDRLRHLRNHGMPPEAGRRYEYIGLGYNTRMTEMAAAIGMVQLKKIGASNKTRIENAKLYNKELRDIPEIVPPKLQAKTKHVFHQYTIRIKPKRTSSIEVRKQLMKDLDKVGVMARIYYPSSLADVKHLGAVSRKVSSLTNTDAAIREVLSLPIGPHVTKNDIIRIVKSIKKTLHHE